MSTRPYVSPSTVAPVRAVLFDVFGTVVDWRTGIIGEVGTFAAAHGLDLEEEGFAEHWRGLYQPAAAAEYGQTRRPAVGRHHRLRPDPGL